MVNHWYFYGFDADFGPFYIKFCGYFPYTGQIYSTGTSTPSGSARKAGIGFTALDNAFGAADDPAAVQQICDGLTDQKIYRFAGKWLARLPHPFTRADEDADYCWQLSVQQAEFSTTMALDRPARGRIFFEQLIRDNIDIGRPDKVDIVFARKIRLRGKNPTPGDLPDPGRSPAGPAPTSTCTTRRPRSSSTSKKDGRCGPRPPSTSRAKRTRSSQRVQGGA